MITLVREIIGHLHNDIYSQDYLEAFKNHFPELVELLKKNIANDSSETLFCLENWLQSINTLNEEFSSFEAKIKELPFDVVDGLRFHFCYIHNVENDRSNLIINGLLEKVDQAQRPNLDGVRFCARKVRDGSDGKEGGLYKFFYWTVYRFSF